jgi:hypothetical protein
LDSLKLLQCSQDPFPTPFSSFLRCYKAFLRRFFEKLRKALNMALNKALNDLNEGPDKEAYRSFYPKAR